MHLTHSCRRVLQQAGIDPRRFDCYFLVPSDEAVQLMGQSVYQTKGKHSHWTGGPRVLIATISNEEANMLRLISELDIEQANRDRQARLARIEADKNALASLPDEIRMGEEIFRIDQKHGEVLDYYGNFLFSLHGPATLAQVENQLLSFMEDSQFIGD